MSRPWDSGGAAATAFRGLLGERVRLAHRHTRCTMTGSMREDIQTLADDLSDAILTMLDLAPPTVRCPTDEELSIEVVFEELCPATVRMAR